jgi:uncharacterized protein (TIGR00251 family)
MSNQLKVTEASGGVRFGVHVQPRASRSEVSGLHGDALKVRLLSPPVDGAANAALIDLIAERLRVSRGSVRIVSGFQSRLKIVEVAGIAVEEVRRLASAAPEK